MAIDDVKVLATKNVRVFGLPRVGSGPTGAGQQAGSKALLLTREVDTVPSTLAQAMCYMGIHR